MRKKQKKIHIFYLWVISIKASDYLHFGADSVKGSLKLTKNNIIIKDPLTFKSGSSEFKWNGEVRKGDKGSLDEIDLEVVMTLPLKEYLPAYALILGGPVTAGVVYIAGKR